MKYCFPPQRLVIDACAELAKEIALPKVQPSPPNAMSRWLTQGNAGDKTKDQVKEQNILFVVGYVFGDDCLCPRG